MDRRYSLASQNTMNALGSTIRSARSYWLWIVLAMLLLSTFYCVKSTQYSGDEDENFMPTWTFLFGRKNKQKSILGEFQKVMDDLRLPFIITGELVSEAMARGDVSGNSRLIIFVKSHHVRRMIESTAVFLKHGLGLSDNPDGTIRVSGPFANGPSQEVSITVAPIKQVGKQWVSEFGTFADADLFPLRYYQVGHLLLPGPYAYSRVVCGRFAYQGPPPTRMPPIVYVPRPAQMPIYVPQPPRMVVDKRTYRDPLRMSVRCSSCAL